MQKMQAAAGNKPLGPNGQPSPAQIEAMRVCFRSPTLVCMTELMEFLPQKAMPPEMMRKLRAAGPQGAQKMMQDMMGGMGEGGGPGGMDFGSMMRSMMGGGGGGGMPDMAQMQGELRFSRMKRPLTSLAEAMKSMGMGGGGGGMPGEPKLIPYLATLIFTDMGSLMKMMGRG